MERPNLPRFKIFSVTFSLIIIAAPLAFTQTGLPLRGKIATAEGQPIAGATVYSTYRCCPPREDSADTDKFGGFRLEHAGAVIHVLKRGFDPKTVVRETADSNLVITLSSARKEMVVPNCRAVPEGRKRLGWGRYGVQFDVPISRVKIRGGKPDIDNVGYVLMLPNSAGYLEIEFGVYGDFSEPEDDQFMKSADFIERSLFDSDGNERGQDSSGHLKDGRAWRKFSMEFGAALYRDAASQDARVFDQIIATACLVPYPHR